VCVTVFVPALWASQPISVCSCLTCACSAPRLNMLVAIGLIAAAIGFVTGGVMSVVGGSGGNYGIAARGKGMMGWAGLGAALIAGATAIINWFWGLGLLI